MPLLHAQAWVFSIFLQYIVGYRRKVVLDNLQKAFPEKSDQEINKIVRQFYLGFCQVVVEILKMVSISTTGLARRVRFLNPEVLPEMTAHGGGAVVVFAHYANWEWMGAGMAPQMPLPTIGVYKTLSSKVFDRLMLYIRTRHGNEMITMEQTLRTSLVRLRQPCYIAFLSDQTPPRTAGMYFAQFLGRPTPVFLGSATIALKMNVPLYYADLRRERPGHYTLAYLKVPHEDLLPFSEAAVQALTDRHVAILERIIRENPAPWLWSHRRWKHSPRAEDILSPALRAKAK